MKKIVCFGDSITEMGNMTELHGYVAQLSDRYARKADVLSRGFSGYTTREAVQLLDEAVLKENPDIVVLFFGANDSVMPGQIQHVPLEEYRQHLKAMASRIATAGAWLVLVTPPPVDEARVKNRKLENTTAYAHACLKLGQQMNVPVANLFDEIQWVADWKKKCLSDGLHLSADGMNCLYTCLAKALDSICPFNRLERLGLKGM